jgi:hypothetical protein
MPLKRCEKCGLPLRLSRGYVWPGNGAIFAKHDPEMRMCIFEDGYYPFVWSELENRLGISIADAMIRGQQASTREYLENNILYGWRRRLLRWLPLMPFIQRIADETSLFGFGNVQVVKYERGTALVIKVRNPFDIISLAWGIKGLVDFVEDSGSDLAWYEEGGEYTISVILRPKSGSDQVVDESARRALKTARDELSFGGEYLAHQGEKFERCPLCGVPAGLAELEWREEDGAIYSAEGTRFIFTSGHVVVCVARDLELRTGRELDSFLMQTTRLWQLRELQKSRFSSRAEAYNTMASRLRVFGFGDVWEISYGEGYLDVLISNPLHVPRIVGRVAGLFEYVEGEEAEVKYSSPEPRLIKIEVKTA